MRPHTAGTPLFLVSLLPPVLTAAATTDNQQFKPGEHAVALLDGDNNRTPAGFIGVDDADAIALMTTKLPHYSSYGVLAFELPEVKNILKNHMGVQVSPMGRQLL